MGPRFYVAGLIVHVGCQIRVILRPESFGLKVSNGESPSEQFLSMGDLFQNKLAFGDCCRIIFIVSKQKISYPPMINLFLGRLYFKLFLLVPDLSKYVYFLIL